MRVIGYVSRLGKCECKSGDNAMQKSQSTGLHFFLNLTCKYVISSLFVSQVEHNL